jgi:hypothetical protein
LGRTASHRYPRLVVGVEAIEEPAELPTAPIPLRIRVAPDQQVIDFKTANSLLPSNGFEDEYLPVQRTGGLASGKNKLHRAKPTASLQNKIQRF